MTSEASSSEERPVALITGSTRGIGLACARRFAKAGYAVVLNGASEASIVTAVAARLEQELSVPALGVVADAADEAQVGACYQAVWKRFRRLDVLVNNAGVLADGRIGMISSAVARRALDVNVLGCLAHTQAAARLMGRRRAGAIVNVSSIMGVRGAVGAAAYAATKAAVIGLTLSAARELGPSGIRVNAVAPGLIETDMLATLSPELRAERLQAVPLGRVGTPDEVADAVLFLAEARYVSGQVLGVDGAMVG